MAIFRHMTIIISIFVFVVWTCYRLIFPENLLLEDLILKPLVWLVPVFIVTRFKNLGFSTKNINKNICIGLAVGLLLALERVYVNKLTPSFSYIIIISAFFIAVTEEIFFRGYLLNRWLEKFKNPLIPLILNGLFFTLTHIPIAIFVYHYYGYSLFTYLLTNFVSGFVDIYLFYRTKSIIAPITNHFVWNIFSGLFR